MYIILTYSNSLDDTPSLLMLQKKSLRILFLVISISAVSAVCKLFLAQSTKIDDERGVYAGVDFQEDLVIEDSVTVYVPQSIIAGTQLSNYVYGAGEKDISLMPYGAAMIYNHAFRRDIFHEWKDFNPRSMAEVSSQSYTTGTDVIYRSYHPIAAGKEIFTSYGDEDWFTLRNIQLIKIGKVC